MNFAGPPPAAACAASSIGPRLQELVDHGEHNQAVAQELLLLAKEGRRYRSDHEAAAWAELSAARSLQLIGQLDHARSVLERTSAWAQTQGMRLVQWGCEVNHTLWLHASGKTSEAMRRALGLTRSAHFQRLPDDAQARTYALTAHLLQWFDPGVAVDNAFELAEQTWTKANMSPPWSYLVLRGQSALDRLLWSTEALCGLLPALAGADEGQEMYFDQLAEAMRRLRQAAPMPVEPGSRQRLEVTVLERLFRALRSADPQHAVGALCALQESGLRCLELSFETRYRAAGVLLSINHPQLAEGVMATLALQPSAQMPVPQRLLALHLQSRVALARGAYREALSCYQRYASSTWQELAYIAPGLRDDLAHFHANSRGKAPPRRQSVRQAFVDQALRLVEDDPGHATVADLAAKVGVSDRALRAAFVSHLDITPKEFITRARLDAAHRFIASDEGAGLSVAEVAVRFGFTHAGRFSSLYRKRFGHGPRDASSLRLGDQAVRSRRAANT